MPHLLTLILGEETVLAPPHKVPLCPSGGSYVSGPSCFPTYCVTMLSVHPGQGSPEAPPSQSRVQQKAPLKPGARPKLHVRSSSRIFIITVLCGLVFCYALVSLNLFFLNFGIV